MLNYTLREKVCDRKRKGVVCVCVCVERVYSFVQCTLLMLYRCMGTVFSGV